MIGTYLIEPPMADAWIIPYCPDFYFLPTLHFHQIFKEWDNGSWNCPAYWLSIGIAPIPCFVTDSEQEADCWMSEDKYGRWRGDCILKQEGSLSLWTEALNASRNVQQAVQMYRFDKSTPLSRGAIVGPSPTWKRV